MGKAPVVFDRAVDELFCCGVKAPGKAQLHIKKGDAPGPQTSMCGGRRTRSETPPSMKNCPVSLYSQDSTTSLLKAVFCLFIDEQSLRPQSSGA
jgi:hypothetical protein